MGMEIGRVVGVAPVASQGQSAPRVQLLTQREARPQLGAGGQDEATLGPLLGQQEPEPQRAGFGDGTVSVPTATVRTIGRNLNEARRLLPSQEEIQTQVRDRVASLRDQLKSQQPAQVQAQPLDLVQPKVEAKRAARAYVSQLNEAAGVAQSRLKGEQPEPTGPNATIRIGNETTNLRRQPGTPALDVLA